MNTYTSIINKKIFFASNFHKNFQKYENKEKFNEMM